MILGWSLIFLEGLAAWVNLTTSYDNTMETMAEMNEESDWEIKTGKYPRD